MDYNVYDFIGKANETVQLVILHQTNILLCEIR